MKNYFVYILECSDRSYYAGATGNLEKRLSEHNEGIFPNCYTYKRRPVKLVFNEMFSSPFDAIRAERQIKGWSRKKKEALICRNFDLLKELSKCKNISSHLNLNSSFDSAQDDN